MHSLASVISPLPLSSKLSAATFHPSVQEATHLSSSSVPHALALAAATAPPSSPKPSPPPLPSRANMSPQPCTRPLSSTSLRSKSQPKPKPRPTTRDIFSDYSSSVVAPTISAPASRPSYFSSFHSLTIDTDDESDDEPAPFISQYSSRSQTYSTSATSVFPLQNSPSFAPPSTTPDIQQLTRRLTPDVKSFAPDSLKRDGLDQDSDYDEDGDDDDDDDDDDDINSNDDYDYDGNDGDVDDGDAEGAIDPIVGQLDHLSDLHDDQEPCEADWSPSSQLGRLFPTRSQPIPVPGTQRKGNTLPHAHTVDAINSNAYNNQVDSSIHFAGARPLGLWFLPPGSRRRAQASQHTTTHSAAPLVVGRPASARRRSVQFDERAFY